MKNNRLKNNRSTERAVSRLTISAFLIMVMIVFAIPAAQAQDWAKVRTGRLYYPALDNLDMREGTIECWIKLGFEPSDGLPAKQYTSFAMLFDIEGESGSMRPHFNAQAGKTEASWFCSIAPNTHFAGFFTTHEPWHKDEWHHFALTWKEKEMALYLDGKKAGGRIQDLSLYQGFGPVSTKQIRFGAEQGVGSMITLDDLRISRVARKPEELGFHGKLQPDVFTAILDGFEATFTPDGKTVTQPEVMLSGNGGLVTAPCQFVEGKYGRALSFYSQ